MKDQHKLIKGYRDLTQAEIDLMNRIKQAEAEVIAPLVNELKGMGGGADQRWVAIGRTHMQEGFSALVRAVAQPETNY